MLHARPDYNRIQDPAGKIGDDEPVFLLRAQDLAMVETLEAYVTAAARVGAKDNVFKAVNQHIARVKKWQRENPTKAPDL